MLDAAICFMDSSGEYYKRALVTAASLFANASVPVRLHLVHGTPLSAGVRRRFDDVALAAGGEVVCYEAPAMPESITRRMADWLGVGTLYRLMLPQLMSAERVLYLDCDIVCECDAAQSLDHDVRGVFLGVTPFGGRKKLPYFVKKMGLDVTRYFNAGVLIMNLDKLRREMPDLAERVFEIMLEHKGRMADQEALNILFNKRPDGLLLLPDYYNFRVWQSNHACLPLTEYNGKILHFSGKKPWQEFSHAGIYYWKYHSRLFPEDNACEIMTALPSYEHAELCAFMLKNSLARSFVRRLYEIRKSGLFKTLRHRLTQGSGEYRDGVAKR